MKRKQLLYVTECNGKRFDTLHTRDQLPFLKTRGRWAEYSLQDAFLLRILLAFIDDIPDVSGERYRALKIRSATRIVNEVASKLPHIDSRRALEAFSKKDRFFCAFVCSSAPQEMDRDLHAEFFLCTYGDMLSRMRGGGDSVERVFAVNASNEARVLLRRLEEQPLSGGASKEAVAAKLAKGLEALRDKVKPAG
jgi:hypothetical protein